MQNQPVRLKSKAFGTYSLANTLQITTEYITTSWAVVKGFFTREQRLLEHITLVEKSLHQAWWQSQQDRVAYKTLLSQYNQLYEGYQTILGSYESLLKATGESSRDTPPPSAYKELAIIFEKPDCFDNDNCGNVDDFDDNLKEEASV